jgi:hypothetical protein
MTGHLQAEFGGCGQPQPHPPSALSCRQPLTAGCQRCQQAARLGRRRGVAGGSCGRVTVLCDNGLGAHTRLVHELQRVEIAAKAGALAWVGGELYDVAAGWLRFPLDGSRPVRRADGHPRAQHRASSRVNRVAAGRFLARGPARVPHRYGPSACLARLINARS